MPTVDRSQTERIRRMRAQIQAVRRAECFTCLEEGPRGPVDESTRTSRKFGQSIYYKQNASGQVTPSECCGSTGACPVNFDAYNALYPDSRVLQFTINNNGTITITATLNGITATDTTPLNFVTTNQTVNGLPKGVYANSSNGPINIIDNGSIILTLNPCGAFLKA